MHLETDDCRFLPHLVQFITSHSTQNISAVRTASLNTVRFSHNRILRVKPERLSPIRNCNTEVNNHLKFLRQQMVSIRFA
jgi:hypothetical protein